LKLDILLFDEFETLDAMGPAEVFGRLPDAYRLSCRSFAGGTVRSAQGIAFLTEPFSEGGDLLLVPGGMGTRTLVDDGEFIAGLGRLCKTASYVLTVCTGSALLARTGLLDGRQATTNKIAFDWAVSQGRRVRWQRRARWTADGKYYTSSGVSAGIDMALGFVADLRGRETAREIARRVEYVWNEDADNGPWARESPPE
jgi:putative intracellular protease/amidase